MWAATLVASLALLYGGAEAFSVNMDVPATADLGAQVVLSAPYQLAVGEYVQRLTWSKDGQVFLIYGERPFSEQFFDVAGININRELGGTPERVVLENVGFDTSGNYELSVEVTDESASGSSSSTYQQSQSLQVGGGSGLGNRFGGSARPADTSSTTFISSSSSAGNAPAASFGGTLGNRFGGNSGGSSSSGGVQATQGLNNAVNSLQQAADRLNAIANALNG